MCATLECWQVPLLRRCLQLAQHRENVGALGFPKQTFVHLAVGNLGSHRRLAGGLQAGVALDVAGPGICGHG